MRRLLNLIPHTTITVDGVPYLTRYYLLGKDWAWGNIYLHHFHSSDQGDELHSHPWVWGFSVVLWGGYSEERVGSPDCWSAPTVRTDHVKPVPGIVRRDITPGTTNFLRLTDFHRVDLRDEQRGAWTLFFRGKRVTDWGFLDRHTSEYRLWWTNPEAIP
jgi:hypothetical protein